MPVPEFFYEPDGGGYLAAELTRGPWDPGIGLADTNLHDERGPIGHALQTLLVDRRQTG
jgi:hypothetical protein